MRAYLVIALAALLAACGTTPRQNPVASQARSGVIVAGTLSLGPCEMSVAPYQTRIRVVAEKAHRRLDDGRMTITQAKAVLDKGDALAAALDSVCPMERAGRLDEAAYNRGHAVRELPALEALIPESKR